MIVMPISFVCRHLIMFNLSGPKWLSQVSIFNSEPWAAVQLGCASTIINYFWSDLEFLTAMTFNDVGFVVMCLKIPTLFNAHHPEIAGNSPSLCILGFLNLV